LLPDQRGRGRSEKTEAVAISVIIARAKLKVPGGSASEALHRGEQLKDAGIAVGINSDERIVGSNLGRECLGR
jgi:hypothetical protein